jgi:hypothetical protein
MNWLSRGVAFATGHPRTAVFLALSVLLLANNLSATDRALYGDAANYWQLGRTFGTDHRFSLHGYVDRLRGYSVPFLLYCVQQAALVLDIDEMALFRGVSAIAGAAAFAVVLPSFFTRVLGVRPSLLTTTAFSLLCFVYWRGHLLHPLSDVPALLLLTMGVLCLPWEGGYRWRLGLALIGGCCLGLAANARPINEAALGGAGLLACWHVARAKSRRRALLAVATFGLGVGMAALPQSLINARTLGTRNPFAHAQVGTAAPNLYLQQLVWGVSIQRYETNIGGTFPVAVMFTDARGQALLGLDPRHDPRNSAHEAQLAIGRYLRLVAGRPLLFASVYSRHLFNGLDIAYSTPYVTRLAPRSVMFALVNYFVLSLAVVYGVYAGRRIRLHEIGWRLSLVGVFLLPSLLAIPTAIECRFLLPLWMLAHGFVVFRLLGSDAPRELARLPYLLVAVAVGVVASFALASATYAQVLGAPASFQTWCLRCLA